MDPLIPGLIDDLGRACLIRVPFQDLPTITGVCRSWKAETSLSEFRHLRKAAGVTRPVLVLAQARPTDPNQEPGHGVKQIPTRPVYGLTAFDPTIGSWSSLPVIPGLSEGLPMFCGLVGSGLDLMVIGGWDSATWRASNSVYVYNFLSGKWRRGEEMPGPRRSLFGCAASDLDRTVVVAGGHDEDKNALRSAIMYDLERDKWVPLPDMARERDECKVIFHRGKFDVISGYPTTMQGRFERSVETFDPATWQWASVIVDFLELSVDPSLCMVSSEGRMFMCAGQRGGDVAVMQGDSWKTVTNVPADVCCSQWMTMCGEKMVVIGSLKFGETPNCQVLDLYNYKWSRMDMPKEYGGHVQCACVMEL